jgi:hypothetical protein
MVTLFNGFGIVAGLWLLVLGYAMHREKATAVWAFPGLSEAQSGLVIMTAGAFSLIASVVSAV